MFLVYHRSILEKSGKLYQFKLLENLIISELLCFIILNVIYLWLYATIRKYEVYYNEMLTTSQKCLSLFIAMIQEAQEQRHYSFINTKVIEKRKKPNYFCTELTRCKKSLPAIFLWCCCWSLLCYAAECVVLGWILCARTEEIWRVIPGLSSCQMLIWLR